MNPVNLEEDSQSKSLFITHYRHVLPYDLPYVLL
jgi:hypothetical protein